MNSKYPPHPRFRDLAPEDVQYVCNGCGGKGSWVKPPYRIFFETSCDHHDFNYWLGCVEVDRKWADEQLRDSMLRDANRLKQFWKRWYYSSWAYIYFVAVRLGGKDFFYYGPSQRTGQDLERYIEYQKAKRGQQASTGCGCT